MKYTFDDKKHVHLLDGEPLYGTSTVIKEVMPPFLAKWGAQCAVDYIKEHKVLLGTEDEEKVLTDAVNAWSKVRQKAADKGTDMHAELEKYVTCMITDFDGTPQELNDGNEVDPEFEKIQKFAEWAVSSVDKFIASEKYTYSKELWVGGIVDCVAKLRDGSLAVIDFKSSKDAYFNQFAQAAGYALQLQESGYGNADGSDWQKLENPITKLIVVPFGAKAFKIEVIENVMGYQEVFKSLVNVYSFLNSFNKK